MGGRSPSVATGSPASSRPCTGNSLQPLKLEIRPARWPRARAVSQGTPGWSSGSGDPYVPGQRPRTSRAPAWAPRSPALGSLPASDPGGPARRTRPAAPPAAPVLLRTEVPGPARGGGASELRPPRSHAPPRPPAPAVPPRSGRRLAGCSVRLTPVGGGEPLLQILFPPRRRIFIPVAGNSYSEKFSSPFNDHWQSKKPSPPQNPCCSFLICKVRIVVYTSWSYWEYSRS